MTNIFPPRSLFFSLCPLGRTKGREEANHQEGLHYQVVSSPLPPSGVGWVVEVATDEKLSALFCFPSVHFFLSFFPLSLFSTRLDRERASSRGSVVRFLLLSLSLLCRRRRRGCKKGRERRKRKEQWGEVIKKLSRLLLEKRNRG